MLFGSTRLLPALALVPILLFIGCKSSQPTTGSMEDDAGAPLAYQLGMSPVEDLFYVTLTVDDLSDANAIYQFASTAPGTYQVHDIGRFVRSFDAYSADGTEIPTEQTSVNQWTISDPSSVARIEYSIAETWDNPVVEHPVYLMSGTSIEADHALINGHVVLGYPTGMQSRAIEISIDRDTSWVVGTALETDADGDFRADSYDHLVDSPILMGRLSVATLDVRGSDVEIYTYSKTDKVHSDQILEATSDILESAGDFLNGLPVDRYTFLFHFEDVSMGAWEHSYSSVYVLSEANFPQEIQEMIPDIVAHEFFHIVTPLNIHSEIIEQFNFVEPVPSEHLWLYEGTTEWAAHIMQLRSGLITLEEYLDRISEKLAIDEQFDQSYSLSKLSLTSYTAEGAQQYANIYMRGALVAGLLDIRLLELSAGEVGLREVLAELSEDYGPQRAFSETEFFEEFTERTYPEIMDFFNRYVRDAQPLPIEEYYGKMGIDYVAERATGEMTANSGIQIMFNGEDFFIGTASGPAAECGFAQGDVLAGINGTDVSMDNIHQLAGEFSQLGPNEPYTMKVERGGEELSITCEKEMSEHVEEHVFTVDDPSQEEAALRSAWMTNLP